MIAYKNCTPNELDYTVGKGGKTTISVNGKDIVLTFEDIPAENPKYMDIKILVHLLLCLFLLLFRL